MVTPGCFCVTGGGNLGTSDFGDGCDFLFVRCWIKLDCHRVHGNLALHRTHRRIRSTLDRIRLLRSGSRTHNRQK